ncbi:hypothetical protein UY3_06294 [Chelonia mydas]|uniref:Uncharacterized protein n=1 Tax=Chelonia mydas TaxID=8469 RepID=M7BH44_CHEMY|nr:hypothetical protein UY3_06294 [Chelonia mydas]
MEAALQPLGPERPTPAQASSVRSAPEPSGDLAPVKHRKLSAPERQARPRHQSSSPVRPPVQPKGRRGHSLHRRLAPPKAPSTNKSGKAAVPVLIQVVPAAQAPPSPDLSELSADDGLKGIMDQPSTPGTFEAAKDLIELSAASPLPYGETSRGKPAMVCPSKTLSRHRSWSWSRLSSDSADSHLPVAQKEIAAPAVGRCEEAPGRAHRSLAPTRDRHWEELRQPSPEVSRRWSRSRGSGPAQPGAAHSPAGANGWHRRGLRDWHRCSLAPAPAAIATCTGARTAGTLRGAGNLNGGRRAIGPSGPPGPIRSTKEPRPGQVTRCSGPGPRSNARQCWRQQYPGLQHSPSLDLSRGPLPQEMGSRRTNQRGSSSS